MLDKLFVPLNKFTRSLSFKLSFYAGITMLIALLVFSYFFIRSQEETSTAKIIQEALKDSEVVKAAVWNGMMSNDREGIEKIVKTMSLHGEFKEINIYDAKGVLHYSSRSKFDRESYGASDNSLLRNIGTDPNVRHKFSMDGNSIYVVNPILNEKSCSTAACHAHPESQKILGALDLKFGLESLKSETLANSRKTLVFGVGLFLLITTISGFAVISFVIPHIRKLQENAAKLARGEYNPLYQNHGSDEMADLMRSFDNMSRQINRRTAELEASRKLYRSLFEEVPCYLTVVSPDYRIVRSNRAFAEVFGNLIGKNCFSGYKGLSSRCRDCPVEKTFSDGISHQSEEVWQVDGRNAYVIVKTSPILDDNGKVAEVLEMSVDVTKLKRFQHILAKAQEEYKDLFENVPCYLTVVDRDFNIVRTNREFERDFGVGAGRKCFAAYKEFDTRCENCPVYETFQDGESHQSEEIWRRNGQETCILVHTAPLRDENGEITSVLEMCTNITEIKRLQSELVILGETIAGMSHSVKNILSGLQGGVYVLDSGLQRRKEDRIRIGWDMVKNNVQKISDLVTSILYASKEREPDYRECDPGRVLSEVCDLFQEKAQLERISITRDFAPEMGVCLLDPAGIHSAVSNLISNAMEACAPGGNGTEHAIAVSARYQGGRLLIQVADDGRGMPKEVKAQLFNKFYSTKGSRGTGLGLVITRKVVEEHGGTIRVESEQGRGTTFFIDIPAKRPAVSASPELPNSAADEHHGV